jgi:regulator of replication initiation timing
MDLESMEHLKDLIEKNRALTIQIEDIKKSLAEIARYIDEQETWRREQNERN